MLTSVPVFIPVSLKEGKINITPIVLIIIFITASACQRQDRPKPPEPFDFDYSPYFIHDQECQQSQGLRSSSIQFASLDSGDVNTLIDVNAETSLQTPLISRTLYGQVYYRRCEHYDSKSDRCYDRDFKPASWRYRKNSGGLLRICSNSQAYPRESFEYIALRSAYHLQSAHDFYLGSIGEPLPKMVLQVMPYFQTLFQEAQALRYDNIVYYPYRKSLVILPRRPQSENLWDSPYVMAHEFAHHMQFSLAAPSIDSIALRRFAAKSLPRPTQSSLEALYEGWADVYAYYATGENPTLITSYSCFGYNRDVSNAYFHDQTFKHLTAAHLELFYHDSHHATGSCSIPNFSDPHIIGAVFAHHLYKIANYVLNATLGELTASQKYGYVHRWLLDAPTLQLSDDDPFVDMIKHVYQRVHQHLVAHDQSDLLYQTCQMFERGFPSIGTCQELTL